MFSNILRMKKRKIVTNNFKLLSISMLAEYYNEFKDNAEYVFRNEDIMKIIRDQNQKNYRKYCSSAYGYFFRNR